MRHVTRRRHQNRTSSAGRHSTRHRIGKVAALVVVALLAGGCRTDIVTSFDDDGADIAIVFAGEMAAWFRESPADAERLAALMSAVGSEPAEISDRGNEVELSVTDIPVVDVTAVADLTGVALVEHSDDSLYVDLVAPEMVVDAVENAVDQLPTRETMYETTFVVISAEGRSAEGPDVNSGAWEVRDGRVWIYRDVATLMEGEETWRIVGWGGDSGWMKYAVAGVGVVLGAVVAITWIRRRRNVEPAPHNVV